MTNWTCYLIFLVSDADAAIVFNRSLLKSFVNTVFEHSVKANIGIYTFSLAKCSGSE